MIAAKTIEHEEGFLWELSRFSSLVPLATSQQRGWSSVAARIVLLQRAEVLSFSCANHCVNWHLQGSVRVRWQHDRYDRTEPSGPGCITIVPGGDRHRFEVSGPCKFLNWALDPRKIESLTEQEAGFAGRPLDLEPLLAGHDPALWALGDGMVRELNQPGLGSRLCVESLELGLIVQLLRRCAPATQSPAPGSGNLPAHKLRVAIDFIKGNLAQQVTLPRLAGAVGMSPYHFAKVFKRSTGLSPHRFVVEQRVEKAKQLLQEGDLSIAETALSTGFASQSHLTAVFRRLIGVTPAVYQKACG